MESGFLVYVLSVPLSHTCYLSQVTCWCRRCKGSELPDGLCCRRSCRFFGWPWRLQVLVSALSVSVLCGSWAVALLQVTIDLTSESFTLGLHTLLLDITHFIPDAVEVLTSVLLVHERSLFPCRVGSCVGPAAPLNWRAECVGLLFPTCGLFRASASPCVLLGVPVFEQTDTPPRVMPDSVFRYSRDICWQMSLCFSLDRHKNGPFRSLIFQRAFLYNVWCFLF